jgi:hypothetical protein
MSPSALLSSVGIAIIGLATKKSVEEHRPVKIDEIRKAYGL